LSLALGDPVRQCHSGELAVGRHAWRTFGEYLQLRGPRRCPRVI
jgi:hypothetical protein